MRLDLPDSEETIVVAVSGGADSSALLLALDELIKREKLRLTPVVAHLDHGLREESGKDAEWVSELAKSLGYKVATARANLKTRRKKRSRQAPPSLNAISSRQQEMRATSFCARPPGIRIQTLF